MINIKNKNTYTHHFLFFLTTYGLPSLSITISVSSSSFFSYLLLLLIASSLYAFVLYSIIGVELN